MILLILSILLLLSRTPMQESPAALLEHIREANFPEKSLQACWHQVKHSSLLVEDLVSEGVVYLLQPDKIRWETTSPVQQVKILSGGTQARNRFRIPTPKDFKISVLEGDQLIVKLTPIRRDLKQMIGEIALNVNPETLKIQFVTLTSPEGDWSRIDFSQVQRDIPLDAALFE